MHSNGLVPLIRDRHGCSPTTWGVWEWCTILLAQQHYTGHSMGRDWHWLELIYHPRQVSAGLVKGRSEERGLSGEQLLRSCAM